MRQITELLRTNVRRCISVRLLRKAREAHHVREAHSPKSQPTTYLIRIEITRITLIADKPSNYPVFDMITDCELLM